MPTLTGHKVKFLDNLRFRYKLIIWSIMHVPIKKKKKKLPSHLWSQLSVCLLLARRVYIYICGSILASNVGGHVKVAVIPKASLALSSEFIWVLSHHTGTSCEFSGSLQLAMGTTTATMDRNADGEQGRRKKKGGFKTMPLILGEEIVYAASAYVTVVYTNLCSLLKLRN